MQALYQLAREEVWACGRHCGRAVAGRAAAEAAGPSWLWGDGEVDGLWPVPIPPPSLHTELCRELFCSEDVRTQAVPPLNHREEQLPELLKWGLLDTVTACCSSGGFSAPHPLSLELQLHLPTPHSPFTSYVLQVYSVLSLVLLACVSLHLSILIPSLFSLSGKKTNKQTNQEWNSFQVLFPGCFCWTRLHVGLLHFLQLPSLFVLPVRAPGRGWLQLCVYRAYWDWRRSVLSSP